MRVPIIDYPCSLSFTRDGVKKTGIVCSAAFIFDSLQTQQEVDIFHAIRRVQASRPQFIHSEVRCTEYITNSFTASSKPYYW